MTPYAEFDESDDSGLKIVVFASRGQKDAIRQAIAKGVDVNTTGVYRETALHWAAARGDIEMVDMLLRAGAFTTMVMFEGKTPDEVALEYGHPELHDALSQLADTQSRCPVDVPAGLDGLPKSIRHTRGR